MRRFPRLLALPLLALLLCCDLVSSARSHSRQKTICEEISNDRKAPMNCNCHSFMTIDCWIVKPLAREDQFWDHHFTSQPQLEKVMLKQHENGILDYLPTHVLHLLRNVRVFELPYVQMSELPEHSFANFSRLINLSITEGNIQKLREHSFENMRNLVSLNLGKNSISEIGRNTFVDLPSLRTLCLDHNEIKQVRDNAFNHLTSLHKLQLDHNHISVITRECFHGLRTLQHLDLRNNNISLIGEHNFLDMPELEVLELDNNNITFIEMNAFSKMNKLRKLYLSGNKLTRLDLNVFAGAPNLHYLDLRRNLLKIITGNIVRDIVQNFYEQNSSLYLTGNPLSCDCKNEWIVGVRNETKNMKTKNSMEKLTCYLDNNVTEKVYGLDWQNLDENSGENWRFRETEIDNEDDRNYEEAEDNKISPMNFDVSIKTDCNGKVCYKKRLVEFNKQELPCPQHEDLMASEHPSSHHEKSSTVSNWFNSSSKTGCSVLMATLLMLLFVLFT